MRACLTLSFAVFVSALAATGASAQPYIAPPRAPDMLNPGYYYRTQSGMIYGPNYYVRPCFPPFQGAVLGPTIPNPAGGPGGPGGPDGCGPRCWPNGPAGNAGGAAFPGHLFSRSPRDFFMADTDPRVSPTAYGAFGSYGRTGIDYP
jgi:hypothetical protein